MTARIIIGICFGTVTETTAIQKQNSPGFTLSANLEKRSETDTVSGQLSQDIYPSGAGRWFRPSASEPPG